MVPQAPDRVRIALLIPLVAVLSCKNDMDRVAAIELPASSPDRTTTNAEYYYSDSGRVSNRLRAGKIEEYLAKDDRHTEISDGLELLFYTAAGAEGSVLRARRGRIWPDERRMEVSEQVVFTNAKGETLETEELLWSQDSARVHTDRPVKITRKGDILYGDGLDAAEDFSSYTIRRPHGSLALPPDSTLAP
jgi:LPS export ABC transporter protein LptC